MTFGIVASSHPLSATLPPGPTFAPSDLADLYLWFDAAAITGLSDNDAVSQWDDESGNAIHAVQATGTNQPVYKTGVQNGLSVVRFATNDFLLTAAFPSAQSQPNEIFVVADWNSGEYLVDGTGTQRHAIYDPSGREGMYAGSVYRAGTNIGTAVADLWHGKFATTSSQFRRRAALVLNGGSGPGSQSLGQFTIGAGNGGGFGFLNGDVMEIVVVNDALSESERWQVEQYLSDKWDILAPRRSDSPLTTPTYDGSGQAVHPSVIDFTDHGLSTWNGHRYWMAMTPYPSSNSAYENPSILVSSDGETWSVPVGLTNPIDPSPASGHNSDPCLVYDSGSDTLYCFYRETNGTDYIRAKSSTDGVTWSSEAAVLSSTANTLLACSVLHDGSTWHMWTVDSTASPNNIDYRTSSSPTTGWSSATTCTATPPSGYDFWHLNVVKDQRDGTYHAFMNVCTSGTAGTASRLCLMRSSNATTWSTSGVIMDLPVNGAQWDASQVYSTTGRLKDVDTYQCWYSGANGSTWRIGRAELSTKDAPALP